MRAKRAGHIVNITSMGGKMYSILGAWYHATKHALEGWLDCLRLEVTEFGIKVMFIEPGAYATDFASPASLKISAGMEAYAALRQQAFARGAAMAFGEPQATAQAVLQVVDADEPPLRLFLGTEGMPVARAAYAARLAEWEQWEAVSNAAQGTSIRQAITV